MTRLAKINAIFIENKKNLGAPQFAGYTVGNFEEIVPLLRQALPKFYTDKNACAIFCNKLDECFQEMGDPEGFFDSISKVNLYGWTTTWKIVKNEITIYVMKNLDNDIPLGPKSGIN